MIKSQAWTSCLSLEMRRADFGDRRLSVRLGTLMDSLVARPSASFPKCWSTAGQLEAGYRFVNNPRVLPDEILRPHLEGTSQRALGQRLVRLVHDTTSVEYPGENSRRGLGPLRGKGQGFFAHVTLAVGAGEDRVPLGVLGHSTWTRKHKPKGRAGKPKPRRSVRGGRSEGESLRWAAQARAAQERLPPGTSAVHVMDREADSYALLCALSGSCFVIRAAHDRVIELPPELRAKARDKLKRVLADAPVVLHREVPLSRRRKSKNPLAKIHPPRASRDARLALSARTVHLRRTEYVASELPACLAVNVVRVVELDPPPDATPVEWVLLTNLPIATPEDVAAIVDHYRARWQIEEFFKALKTGCRLEQRQLESVAALWNATAMLLPVAWQLLLMRHQARHAPEAPATQVMTPTQIQVLRSIEHLKLPPRPTMRQAYLALARLGGHIPRNGEPGWQTLASGYRDLLLMEQAWVAASRRRPAK